MTIAAKREKLKNFIETASNAEIDDLINVIEPEIDIEEIEKIKSDYLSGKGKFYTESALFVELKKKHV